MPQNTASYYKELKLPLKIQIIILISQFILVGIFSYYLFYTDTSTFYKYMRKENQPVELITFFILFLASLTAFIFSYRLMISGIKFSGLFYFIFAAGLLFVTMEEISWGQWFFKFSTPDYLSGINKQNEFNLHNIVIVNITFELLRILFGLGGLISIFLARFKRFIYLSSPLSMASWYLIILLFASLDFYNWFDASYRGLYEGNIFWFAAKFTEFLELLISISAFLFIWFNFRKLTKKRPE